MINKIKILIAGSDLKKIRLANALKKYYSDSVIITDDKYSILNACETLNPDVVILPFIIKDTDSFALLKELKKRNEKIPKVIIISEYESEMPKDLNSSIEKNVSVLKAPFHYELLMNEIKNTGKKENEVNSDEADNISDWKNKIILSAERFINNADIQTNVKGYYYIKDCIKETVAKYVESEKNVLLS